MGIKTFVVAALAAVAVSKPIPDPLHIMSRAGPAAGQVITKCAAPGQIALAYDDGPYQYTQKLVDTLTAGGAKGTFFVTGTLYGMFFISHQCIHP
jgi:peptidoglycan/xylan/chitin deacetylase (PgdA/CDA1 family)